MTYDPYFLCALCAALVALAARVLYVTHLDVACGLPCGTARPAAFVFFAFAAMVALVFAVLAIAG